MPSWLVTVIKEEEERSSAVTRSFSMTIVWVPSLKTRYAHVVGIEGKCSAMAARSGSGFRWWDSGLGDDRDGEHGIIKSRRRDGREGRKPRRTKSWWSRNLMLESADLSLLWYGRKLSDTLRPCLRNYKHTPIHTSILCQNLY